MKLKKTFFLVAIAVVLALSMVLVGCESYKQAPLTGADPTAQVFSNGGSILKQGDYIYFINGYAGYQTTRKANAFGNVVTGAIMRVKAADLENTDEDADLMANAEIVVPKAVISDATNTGFSIYGNYLYYVSYTGEEDRSGVVDADRTQFMRTDLNGQNTKVILEIAGGKSTQYKYTPNGLVYMRDGDLYFKSTATNKFDTKKDGELIAESVTAYMPVSATYDPATGMTLSDVVLYTKASEDYGENTQTLYAYMAGGEPIVVLDKDTYLKDVPADQVYKNQFSFSILGFATEANGALTMAYTKTYYSGTQSSDSKTAGTFVYRFDNAKFEFKVEGEHKVADTALSDVTVVGYDAGVLTSASPVTLYAYDSTAKATAYPDAFKDDNGSIASPTICGVKDGWMYYVLSNKLYCYDIAQNSHVHAIGTDSVYTDFIKPEVLEWGGKTRIAFFSNDNKYLYLYTLDGSGNYSELKSVLLGRIPKDDTVAN